MRLLRIGSKDRIVAVTWFSKKDLFLQPDRTSLLHESNEQYVNVCMPVRPGRCNNFPFRLLKES